MNIFITFLLSFIVCGTFCMIGQIILENTTLTNGHITSLFVFIGVILEFFNVYDYIRKIGGMGASMPIISFGSIIMKGVKQAIDTNNLIGVFKGVFDNCGTILSFAIFLASSTHLMKPPSSFENNIIFAP